MRLVQFTMTDGTLMAVNPDKVDAIMEVGIRTRVHAGEFYHDVVEPFHDVLDMLTAKNDEQKADE